MEMLRARGTQPSGSVHKLFSSSGTALGSQPDSPDLISCVSVPRTSRPRRRPRPWRPRAPPGSPGGPAPSSFRRTCTSGTASTPPAATSTGSANRGWLGSSAAKWPDARTSGLRAWTWGRPPPITSSPPPRTSRRPPTAPWADQSPPPHPSPTALSYSGETERSRFVQSKSS